MVALKLTTILEHLKKKGLDAKIQEETNQIYIVYKIEGHEFPLFIQIGTSPDKPLINLFQNHSLFRTQIHGFLVVEYRFYPIEQFGI